MIKNTVIMGAASLVLSISQIGYAADEMKFSNPYPQTVSFHYRPVRSGRPGKYRKIEIPPGESRSIPVNRSENYNLFLRDWNGREYYKLGVKVHRTIKRDGTPIALDQIFSLRGVWLRCPDSRTGRLVFEYYPLAENFRVKFRTALRGRSVEIIPEIPDLTLEVVEYVEEFVEDGVVKEGVVKEFVEIVEVPTPPTQ